MKKKKLVAMALCCMMLCHMGIQAMAVEQVVPISGVENTATVADSVLYYGTVTQVQWDEQKNTASVWMQSERYGEVVMLVNDDTCYVDGGAGTAANASDLLQEGKGLYVYHSPVMTDSLPGQTVAYAFVGNMPMDMACPKYHEVEQVEKREDGTVVVTTDNGSLYLTIAADARISPYLTKNMPSIDDIQVGQYIMAWYDVVLESYPAQAGTNQVLLLPDKAAQQGEPSEQREVVEEDQASMEISIQGKTSGLTYKMQDGVAMVPLRAVAEGLGLNAGYAVEDGKQDITAESDTFAVHMTPGQRTIYGVTKIEGAVGMTAPQDYGVAPYIEGEGITWAPAELFQMLGVTVELDAQGLHFEK